MEYIESFLFCLCASCCQMELVILLSNGLLMVSGYIQHCVNSIFSPRSFKVKMIGLYINNSPEQKRDKIFGIVESVLFGVFKVI